MMWNIPDGYTQAEKFLVEGGQFFFFNDTATTEIYTNDVLDQIYSASPPSTYNVADVCGGTSAG